MRPEEISFNNSNIRIIETSSVYGIFVIDKLCFVKSSNQLRMRMSFFMFSLCNIFWSWWNNRRKVSFINEFRFRNHNITDEFRFRKFYKHYRLFEILFKMIFTVIFIHRWLEVNNFCSNLKMRIIFSVLF